jgi:O-antigen/teichoic acid export membrane protein
VRGRISHALSEPLARSSAGLIASTLVSAFVGIGFWAVAARTFSVREVGHDSALVAVLLTLSGLGQLSLNNMIPRFLPQMRARVGRHVAIAYVCSFVASVIIGTIFIIVAPLASDRFAFIDADPLVWVLFPLSVAAWSIFCLQDAVLIALSKGAWLPIENGLFSLARVAILPIALWLGVGHGVFVAFVLPMFVTLPIINLLIARRALPAGERARDHAAGVVETIGRRPLLRFLALDLTGTMLAQLAMIAVPLLVAGLLGAIATAYFYIPFTLIAAFDMLFFAIATSLTAETARTPARAGALIRKATRWLLFVQAPLAAVIVVAAPLILVPFGPGYVHHGTTLLRLLAAASPLRAVAFLYGGVCRMQGHGSRLLAVEGLAGIAVVVAVTLLAQANGLPGVGLAWLIVWGLVALAVLPAMRHFAGRATVWGSLAPDAALGGGVPAPAVPAP